MSDMELIVHGSIANDLGADRRAIEDGSAHRALRILIVEDDRDQAHELRDYLSEAGYNIDHASDGRAFRALWESGVPDAILLDLNLPGESGTAIVQFVRKSSNVPVLIVSGRHDPVDRVLGLELGADDYILKPFHPRELLARIAAVLRRAKSVRAGDYEAPISADTLRFQGFRFEAREKRLYSPDGTEVHLTSAMFRLIEAFARQPGKTFTRDQLTQFVYGRRWRTDDRSVDNLVLRVRKKLLDHREGFDPFKSVRGAGYVFAVKVEGVRENGQAADQVTSA